uniref:LIM zinc-binding domain-containing protein n=1 Tax=Pelusios castaneus TaxID=367368 RepID=A0A8C8SLZ8_9SAUR
MPKCPRCQKEVYFAEKVTSLGKDWHRPCLKCEKCGKTLTSGSHAEHEGKPYCNQPCYSALFGPKGRFLCDWGFQWGGVGCRIPAHVCLLGLLPRSMITCSSSQSHAPTPLNLAIATPAWTPSSQAPHMPLILWVPPYAPKCGDSWKHLEPYACSKIHLHPLHFSPVLPLQSTCVLTPIHLPPGSHPLTSPYASFPLLWGCATFPCPLLKVTWIRARKALPQI